METQKISFLMRNLWSILIYPFVFWSAVLLAVLDLPHSLNCINHVAGLIQGTGMVSEGKEVLMKQPGAERMEKTFCTNQASCCYCLPQCSALQLHLRGTVPGGCYVWPGPTKFKFYMCYLSMNSLVYWFELTSFLVFDACSYTVLRCW